ncbi:MAG: T9SS type A sorting domain-containing protein [Bacteroidales bacterium]|nr:T9SS type A sorting domain-containing protein [Bacteroidales bacterium]
MKKLLLAAMLAAQVALLYAQSPRQLDTIYGRNPNYLYHPVWIDPYYSVVPRWTRFLPQVEGIGTANAGGSIWAMDSRVVAMKYYVDTPVKIIGAATSFTFMRGDLEVREGSVYPDSGGRWQYHDTNLANLMEYLQIYKHINDNGHDTMMVVREKLFCALDTARCMHSFVDIFAMHNRTFLGGGHLDSTDFAIFEVYYDKPVVITDSFYVGLTQRCRQVDTVYYGQEPRYVMHNRQLRLRQVEYIDTSITNRHLTHEEFDSLYWDYSTYRIAALENWPNGPKWVFHHPSKLPAWANETSGVFWAPFLFPIFDTTGMGLRPFGLPCGMVENFRAANIWDGNAMMVWDGASEHNRWELAVGRADEDPSGYRIYRVNSTSRVLSGLDSNAVYAARVRAECTPKTNYSDWSDTVQFCIGMSQPEGMPSVVDQFTNLAPNPASKRVAVMSSFGLRRVALYDMKGRCAMETDCAGYAVELDVSALPEGAYIAVVTTPGGTVTKRLVVAR